MIDRLLQSIEGSDNDAASPLLGDEIGKKGRAWEIHLSLYPVAQRVMNPPYINPHWPKAYRIARELASYLQPGDLPALVKLEVSEYTQRPKLEQIPKPDGRVSRASFSDIEAAIKAGEPQKAASLLSAFLKSEGAEELARRLLLLGSGYMGNTLGHSVSCTTFVLLEMLERAAAGDDPWPALARLAEYFCKGGFHTTPPLAQGSPQTREHLIKATSGDGIVNLHHMITRYSIERARRLLKDAEYSHMLARWVEFIGDKPAKPVSLRPSEKVAGYEDFLKLFSKGGEGELLPHIAGLVPSAAGRKALGRYIIKGICDRYQGSYDPHFITGLGAALWVVETYSDDPPLALNALRQYLNYYLA